MRTVFAIVFLLCLMPFYAHAESDPFVLPHPVTGEQGVWVPQWVQKLHLETDARLKLCNDTFDTSQALIAEKNAEISARIAAATAFQNALKSTQTQLSATNTQLQSAQSLAETRLFWALVATGVAVITGTILTLSVTN